MPAMEGHLSKQAGGNKAFSYGNFMHKAGKGWDRRYMVLPKDGTTLSYYKTQREWDASKAPAGAVDTASASIRIGTKPGRWTFDVETPKRTLKIKAATEAERDEWIAALSCAGRASSVTHRASALAEPSESVGGNIFTRAFHAVADAVDDVVDGVKDLRDDLTASGLAKVSKEDVDAPTPDERWFTPSLGWPRLTSSAEWKAPPPLCPTADEAPELFDDATTDDDDAIGELRVEILEAEGLPKMDVLTSDPYAVVIFEGSAGRTNVPQSSLAPKWSEGEPRAFRFPIQQAYSAVYVALNDSDKMGDDDHIGRVVIELGSLYNRTQVPCSALPPTLSSQPWPLSSGP